MPSVGLAYPTGKDESCNNLWTMCAQYSLDLDSHVDSIRLGDAKRIAGWAVFICVFFLKCFVDLCI